MAPKGSSAAWDHFTDKGSYIAECKLCNKKLSFKSSVSNLTKHLKLKHPLLNIVPRNQVPPLPSLAETTRSSAQPEQQQQNLPSTSTEIHQSGPSTSTVRVVQSGSKNIASYIYKRNAEKCKSDIDDLIMDLFILDFQPFRIVEDKAFRKLIQTAFPFYIIPSRKYFANNLLPSRFESVRTSKIKQIKDDVESICVTADVWTSSTNDAYLAVTGHYIERENCILKSVLLDCIVLVGSHTGVLLASQILSITDEWNITDKIILAVTDNGANIKKAVEKELGWRHFGCYAHSLNLAIQDAMNLSAELTALIEKVKAIVGYFKRSTKAWEKLKKFQIQADKSVKRPLQSVCTRWNSLFYMLERMLEIKEEVNSALSNLDSTALSLSQIEWEICEHLCHILRPCEEVTKEISGQKYVAGSMVIPITTGLISYLENLDSRLYHPTAQCLQQDLISKLKKRFVNLDKSRIFTRAMFLDPRFKLYFEDPTVAENTKQSIIQSVTSLINKEDREQPIAPAASEEEEQPRPSASSRNPVAATILAAMSVIHRRPHHHLRLRHRQRKMIVADVVTERAMIRPPLHHHHRPHHLRRLKKTIAATRSLDTADDAISDMNIKVAKNFRSDRSEKKKYSVTRTVY